MHPTREPSPFTMMGIVVDGSHGEAVGSKIQAERERERVKHRWMASSFMVVTVPQCQAGQILACLHGALQSQQSFSLQVAFR